MFSNATFFGIVRRPATKMLRSEQDVVRSLYILSDKKKSYILVLFANQPIISQFRMYTFFFQIQCTVVQKKNENKIFFSLIRSPPNS